MSISLRRLFICCFLLFTYLALPINLFSQSDTGTGITIPVTALSKFIKFSNATAKNNLFYPGKVNGFQNGISAFIKDFESQEIFTFETGNYDSIQFYFDLPNSYVDKFFIKVLDNQTFSFEPIPVQELKGLEMIITNIKKFKGKKLYELKLIDDVDPGQIEVMSTIESAPYIDVVPIDSGIYQIKLKGSNEFSLSVSAEVQDDIKKGREVIIPIGVVMKDKVVSSDVQEYKIYLKKKKKPKAS